MPARHPAVMRLTILVVVTSLLLTGCATDDEPVALPIGGVAPPVGGGNPGCDLPTGPVAVVYGARDKSPRPRLPQPVDQLIRASLDQLHPVAAVRVDGEPALEFSATFAPTANSADARSAQLDQFVGQINGELDTIRATTPQADTLAAVSLAGRQIRNSGGTVIVADSGLQTTAPLDFTDGALLAAEPDDVVTFLTAERLLPDLTGLTVALVGIGNTAAGQTALNQRQHDNVVAIWTAIATESGARCVALFDAPGQLEPMAGDLPEVSAVTVPPEPVATLVPCGEIRLPNNGRVGFRPDEAEFVDRAAARAALAELVPTMLNGRQQIELIGTTATYGSREGRREMSERRAKAVAAILVELGVPAERIVTRGVGTEWEGHLPDVGPNGELLPGPAAQNRSVVVRLTCPAKSS